MGRLRRPIIPSTFGLNGRTVAGSLSAAVIFISSWRPRDHSSWRTIILRVTSECNPAAHNIIVVVIILIVIIITISSPQGENGENFSRGGIHSSRNGSGTSARKKARSLPVPVTAESSRPVSLPTSLTPATPPTSSAPSAPQASFIPRLLASSTSSTPSTTHQHGHQRPDTFALLLPALAVLT